MKKGTLSWELMMIPLTVPFAAVIFYLMLVGGLGPLFALAARVMPWPLRDLLAIYLVEIPLAAAAIWQQRGEFRSPGFLVSLAGWLCMNSLLYVGLGSFHS